MAFRRRSCLLAALLSMAFLAGPATADRTGQVAVFWGRNKDEGSLREACDTGLYTMVIISFYSVFGHDTYWGDLSGHPLYGVGDDIKHCQSKIITVLLSIGGGGGKEYSLPSSQSVANVADNLWNAHLGRSRNGVFRPFGDAVVDGIDFFIDQGSPDHYDELARHLSSYNKYYRGRLGVLLTATTRCAYPDRRVEKALATGVFDRIHVRFYDDRRCSYNYNYGGLMKEWSRWTSRFTRSKVYLGLVAANVTGKNDMVGIRELYYHLLPNVQKAANYGGIMLWERFLDTQTYYGEYLRSWA